MGNGPEPGQAVQEAKTEAALAAIAALLAGCAALSGRAIKTALASAHPRAAIEAALTHGVGTGRLTAVDGARNARLYRLAGSVVDAVSSVPSVPAPVSQAVPVSRDDRSALGTAPAAPVASDAGLLTRRELAGLMGVVMSAVTKWEQAGLPVAERGRAGKPSFYREADVREWLNAREALATEGPGLLNVHQERARRERAQAELAEQTFQMRSGDLLPREEVERVWESEIIAVRAKLLQIPPTFADRVYQAALGEGVGGVERTLTESVNDVLRELAADRDAEAQTA